MLTQKQDTPTTGVSCFFSCSCALFLHRSVPAHQCRHLTDTVKRERRFTKRLHCNGHQFHRVIIGCDPVGIQLPAAAAAMDNGPLAALPHPDRNGLHQSAAVRCPVAGLLVNVQAAQAIRAMVAVGTACPLGNHNASAVTAGDHLVAGVCFIITLFKCLAFIFTIHD